MRVVLFAFAAIGIGSLAFNLSALLTVGYENKKMPWYIGMVGAILFVMSVFYLATAGLLDSKRMKKVNKDHVEDLNKVRYLAALNAFPTVKDCEAWGFDVPSKDQVHNKLFEQWRTAEYQKLGMDKED